MRRCYAPRLSVALSLAWALGACQAPRGSGEASASATAPPSSVPAKASAQPSASAQTTATGARPPAAPPGKLIERVYFGKLAEGWQDYGWAERELNKGPARLKLGGYGGWIIAKPAGVKGRFGYLVFRMKSPDAFGDFLEITINGDVGGFEPVTVAAKHRRPAVDGWVEVAVPMKELNQYGVPFDRVIFRAKKVVDPEVVLLEAIGFTAPAPDGSDVVSFPTQEAALDIDCAQPSIPVSAAIFGVGGTTDVAELRPGAMRWGGNPTSRYNWAIGAWNTGQDWYYQNVAVEPHSRFLETARARGVYTAFTLPLLGWVAKDASSSSFPVNVYGAQKGADPNDANRGNGIRADGKPIAADPTRANMRLTPEQVGMFVAGVRSDDQKRGKRTVHQWILDNEPALWNSTHRDVHPDAGTYDELLAKTIAYATAIRKADPEGSIAGPAEWGWPGYFYSAKDAEVGFQKAPDRKAHGNVPLLAWYLRKLKEHEQKTGVRLLDIVDLHFYPQGDHLFSNGGGGSTDSDANARRLRATRALWDPTYVDESWIKDAVRLIPRMKELIAENYPGRGISIGEWNFGAEHHLNGALALGEALGRMAEGGVTSAFYWTAPKKGSPAYWAFRAYRNYDGKGAGFLETYLPSKAPEGMSLYVSRDTSGKRMVAVALNFAPTTVKLAKVRLKSCGAIVKKRAFVYSGNPSGFAESTTLAGSPEGLEQPLPPSSLAVFEIDAAPTP